MNLKPKIYLMWHGSGEHSGPVILDRGEDTVFTNADECAKEADRYAGTMARTFVPLDVAIPEIQRLTGEVERLRGALGRVVGALYPVAEKHELEEFEIDLKFAEAWHIARQALKGDE